MCFSLFFSVFLSRPCCYGLFFLLAFIKVSNTASNSTFFLFLLLFLLLHDHLLLLLLLFSSVFFFLPLFLLLLHLLLLLLLLCFLCFFFFFFCFCFFIIFYNYYFSCLSRELFFRHFLRSYVDFLYVTGLTLSHSHGCENNTRVWSWESHEHSHTYKLMIRDTIIFIEFRIIL